MEASFNHLAAAELREAVAYYRRVSPSLAQRFVLAVETTLNGLLAHPMTGALLRAGIRRKPLAGFPYQLLYLQHGDALRVLAVMHKRRRPLYWVARD